jgi:hypothetical protein
MNNALLSAHFRIADHPQKDEPVRKGVPERRTLQHQCLSATPCALNFSSHLTTIVCKAIR